MIMAATRRQVGAPLPLVSPLHLLRLPCVLVTISIARGGMRVRRRPRHCLSVWVVYELAVYDEAPRRITSRRLCRQLRVTVRSMTLELIPGWRCVYDAVVSRLCLPCIGACVIFTESVQFCSSQQCVVSSDIGGLVLFRCTLKKVCVRFCCLALLVANAIAIHAWKNNSCFSVIGMLCPLKARFIGHEELALRGRINKGI